jgi:ATP-dependent DNA ligase
MTIDERLERLTERHEALTQSIELVIAELRAADAAANERQEALRQSVELLIADGTETGQKIRALAILAEQNEVRAGQMMDAIASMARVVEAHERRIDHLEN